MRVPRSDTQAVWSPDRFYWGVIDAPKALPQRPRRRREALGFLFESSAPVPLDDLHVEYSRIAKGTYVACGVELTALADDSIADADVLRPADWPACVRARLGDVPLPAVPPFNLRSGSAESSRITKARRRCVAEFIAIAMLSCILISIGFERRVADLRVEAGAVDAARAGVYEATLGWKPGDAGALPPEQLLIAELRRLERSRNAEAVEIDLPDATSSLSRLFGAWPPELHGQVESISITGEAMTVRTLVENSEAAAAFADALNRAPGWSAEQPRIDAVRDGIRVTVRLIPKVEEK